MGKAPLTFSVGPHGRRVTASLPVTGLPFSETPRGQVPGANGLRPSTRSLMTTPSAIIDPTGTVVEAHSPAVVSEQESWATRHPLLSVSLILLVGFGLMHLVFVGGPQHGPLLPTQSSAAPNTAADKASIAPEAAKRSQTQPHDRPETAATAEGPRVLTNHPPPPRRPGGI